jgi:hypothetical protein
LAWSSAERIDAAFVCDLRLAAISEHQRLRLGYEPTMSRDSQFRADAQGLQDPLVEIVNDSGEKVFWDHPKENEQ